MCGIVGIWDLKDSIDRGVLCSMNDALAHRGPDDSGIYIDNENALGLGHRRLSIIDLTERGHQPMSNNDQSIWITYNGEIYNYQELRKELTLLGHRFNSSSDTEVVLKSYEQWGIGCLEKFIGMFAIGIWDKTQKKLYLIRDRTGVKPLYYFWDKGVFIFGSEIKALLAHPKFDRSINYDSIPLYLRYGYIPTPHSIYQNTYKVKAGHYLCLSSQGLSETKYWDITNLYLEETFQKSEDQIISELEEVLINAFKYRLVSDVPVGVFLSGGIDSTTLTALLAKTDQKLKTFSVGFHEDNLNEAKWAKQIADYLGTDHTEYYLSSDEGAKILSEMPEIFDEPFADNSCIPTYIVSRMTRQHVKVALSADGGDELFCGYYRYWDTEKMNRLRTKIPIPLRSAVSYGLNMLNPELIDYINRKSGGLFLNPLNTQDRIYKTRAIFNYGNQNQYANLYREISSVTVSERLNKLLSNKINVLQNNQYEDLFSKLSNHNIKTQMMAADLKHYLVDDLLTKLDRVTMSVGLEGRDPFLDQRIIEYAARIPVELKYKNGESKYILKRMLERHVPKNLVDRPKQGFSMPLKSWVTNDLSEIAEHYLDKQKLDREGIFDSDAVGKLHKHIKSGAGININSLWSILMFQMWSEKWISNN